MSKYVIGVDGGGTKTHCALFDINGNMIDLLTLGCTNHEGLSGGFVELKAKLTEMFDDILNKNNIGFSDINKCVLGLAGVDTKRQHEIITQIIADIGINNFILCNDSYLAVKAGCQNGYGISAINGTGFCVTGIDKTGKMLQIGGLGEKSGDKGGGTYLASEVIKRVYNSLFKVAPETVMSDMVFDVMHIKSKYHFTDVISEKFYGGDYRVKINKLLYKAANMGDTTALKILESTGIEYFNAIKGIVNELNFNNDTVTDIVLAGSQFTKGENPKTILTIKEQLKVHIPDMNFNIVLLNCFCVAGAIIWALEDNANSEIKSSVINQLKI